MFEAQLATKIAIAAGQGAINIVSTMKKSKDMQHIAEDIQGISTDICATNKKLDTLIEMGQDQVLGRLIAANKKLATCIAAQNFTGQDVQTIEELYLLNTGLSKDGKTGTYNNSRIIAYSWWGLILLESQTGTDIIKISRYMIEMFDADLPLAQEEFPEIYHEFYQPFIEEYDTTECRYITWLSTLDTQSLEYLLYGKNSYVKPYAIPDTHSEDMTQFIKTSAKDMDDLLEFYGWDYDSRLNSIIEGYSKYVSEQWNGHGLGGKINALKSTVAGVYGGIKALRMTTDVVAQAMMEVMTAFQTKLFLMDIKSNRFNQPEYQIKRRKIVTDMLTTSYLDALHR